MSKGEQNAYVELQERDIEILLSLFECRVLTRSQAAMLHFNGKPEAAKKRLRALRLAGYLGTRPRKPNEPAIFKLTRRGFDLLAAHQRLQRYPPMRWERVERRQRVSPITMQHEIDVVSLRTAFAAAIRAHASLTLTDFCTWPALIGFDAVRRDGSAATIRPDGFVHVCQTVDGMRRQHFFFLEVDRSTESQAILTERLRCYRGFYLRGGLAQRFEAAAGEYKRYPFRVLLTCRSAERCHHVASRLLREAPEVGAQVWMTTLPEALADPLGNIWMIDRDLRQIPLGPHDEVHPTLGKPRMIGDETNGTSVAGERTEKRRLLREGLT